MKESKAPETSAMDNLTTAHDKTAAWCRKVMEDPDPDLAKVKEVMKFLKDNRIEVGVVKADSDLEAAAKVAEEKIRKATARGGEDLLKLFPDASAFKQMASNED